MRKYKKIKERVEYSFGHRVDKTPEHPFGWEVVDVEDINTRQPIVLCFGGNGFTNDKTANGSIKFIERLLGIQQKDNYVDIYSINYGGYMASERDYDKDSRNPAVDERTEVKTGSVTESEKIEIANALFMPLLMDDNGERLPVEQAGKNIRNLNIFTYCYGAEVLSGMLNIVAKKMNKLDYDKLETSAILRQILHISYAPLVNGRYTTNFVVKSFNDEALGLNFMYDFIDGQDDIYFLEDEPQPYLGCGKMILKNNTVTAYTRKIFGEQSENNEHILNMIARDESWRNENHRADTLSRCVAFTLALGVVNSAQNQESKKFIPLLTAEEIMELNRMTLDKGNSSIKEEKQKIEYSKMNNEQEEHTPTL